MASCSSIREAEMHHIAVVNNVVLALETHLARVFRALFSAQRHIVVIGDRLCADETLFEVRVNNACGGGCARAACDRPCARLLRAHREIGDEVEQRVANADEARQSGFVEPQRFEIFVAVGRRQLRQFLFAARGVHIPLRVFGLRLFFDELRIFVARRGGSLVHVADIEHGLRGEGGASPPPPPFLVCAAFFLPAPPGRRVFPRRRRGGARFLCPPCGFAPFPPPPN